MTFAKERHRAERRRQGDASDPFAEASRGERIRAAEIHDDWQRDAIRIMQPVAVFNPSAGFQTDNLLVPTSAAGFLGFGQSSGTGLFHTSSTPMLFGPSASQGAVPFGQTAGGGLFAQSSTSTLFGPSSSQPSNLFGRTTGTQPFGSSASAASGSFGAFGGGSQASSGSTTLFGQSGFGNTSSGAAGVFSPGSSVATNLTASPIRYGSKHNHRSL